MDDAQALAQNYPVRATEALSPIGQDMSPQQRLEENVDELSLLLDAEQASTHDPLESSTEAEESIESYMARLLARSGGKSKSAASPTPPVAVERKVADGQVATEAKPPVAAKPVEQPRQIVRPPESKDVMSNMRALANMSTHAALGTHNNRLMADSAAKQMLLASGLSVASCVLAFLSISYGSVAYGAAVATFAVAMYLGVRFSKLASRITESLGTKGKRASESPAEEPTVSAVPQA